jgi:hypothetical protein
VRAAKFKTSSMPVVGSSSRMEGTPPAAGPERRRTGSPRLRLAVVLGVVVLAALLAVSFVLIGRGGGSSGLTTLSTATATTRSVTPLGPIAATQAVLATIAKASGQPVYWTGTQAGYRYELTRTSAGDVYVRYLPHGAKVGNRQADYRVVGTYPYTGALAALQAYHGGTRTRLAGGGVVLSTTADPKSVHIAYPGLDYQIEVYDPVPGRALALALAGRVTRVG